MKDNSKDPKLIYLPYRMRTERTYVNSECVWSRYWYEQIWIKFKRLLKSIFIKKKNPFILEGKIQTAYHKTWPGRIYSKELFDKALQEYITKINIKNEDTTIGDINH